jgi:DNA-binding response OmpR family regulator
MLAGSRVTLDAQRYLVCFDQQGNAMKILVIDDDYFVRYTLARVLRGNNYEVVTAADGEQGMIVFRRTAPDLVITDIIMPNQEGIETIRLMRRERPDAKIIAISGGGRIGDLDVLEIAHKLGADDVIHKPFDAAELLGRVRKFLATPGDGSDGV